MSKDFSTSDFLTASVLLLRKHLLLSTDTNNPRRVVFIFEDNSRLQDDLISLKQGKLRVDPADFWAAERRCKRIIYEGEAL